jgi:hypothetical protein
MEPTYEIAWSGSAGWSFAPSHGGGLTTYAGGSAAQSLVDDAPHLSGRTAQRDYTKRVVHSDAVLARIGKLFHEGMGPKKIAAAMGLPRTTVQNIVAKRFR